MERVYNLMALAYFLMATIALMILAFILFVSTLWSVADGFVAGDVVPPVLDGIGLIIIGFAVVETSKFIAEEEILQKRELRSPIESRRSLTKFITIIVIAASLEALVMVFKTSREVISDAIYPAILFIAAMTALVALGVYQYLSSRIDTSAAPEIEREVRRFEQRDAEERAGKTSDHASEDR